jgi:hypothetical protein
MIRADPARLAGAAAPAADGSPGRPRLLPRDVSSGSAGAGGHRKRIRLGTGPDRPEARSAACIPGRRGTVEARPGGSRLHLRRRGGLSAQLAKLRPVGELRARRLDARAVLSGLDSRMGSARSRRRWASSTRSTATTTGSRARRPMGRPPPSGFHGPRKIRRSRRATGRTPRSQRSARSSHVAGSVG